MAPFGTLVKAISAVALAYTLSFSEAPKITLENVSSELNCRFENDKIVSEKLSITEYSQIEHVVKDVYKKMTGKEELPLIIMVSAEKMKERISKSATINPNSDALEFIPLERDSMYVVKGEFTYVMSAIAHGLGHYSTPSLDKGGIEGKIIEEAKAVAFDGAWGDELTRYIFVTENKEKKGVNIGRLTHDPEKSPELYVAEQIVEAIRTEKNCDYKKAYEVITTSSYPELIDHVKKCPVLIGLMEGKIKPTAYKSF
jgi:hypothetical protein